MNRSRAMVSAAVVAAVLGTLAPSLVTPALAGGWWYGERQAAPRYYRKAPRYNGNLRYYNSPRAYRSACAYGDCECLRSIAQATGNPVWWDKVQACTGL